MSNSWLYLEGALINEETGAVDEFDLEVSYYSGRGQRRARGAKGGTTRGALHPRRARRPLRAAPGAAVGDAAQRRPRSYDAHACAAGCRASTTLFLAVLALLAWPLLRLWRYFRFETARWSESDHPWMESGDERRRGRVMKTYTVVRAGRARRCGRPGGLAGLGLRGGEARLHPAERAAGARRVPLVQLLERRKVMDWMSSHARPLVDSIVYSIVGTRRARACRST